MVWNWRLSVGWIAVKIRSSQYNASLPPRTNNLMIALQRWKDWFGREKKPYLSQYSSNIHKSAKSWLEFKKEKKHIMTSQNMLVTWNIRMLTLTKNQIVAPLKTIYFSIFLKVKPECQKYENGFEGKRKRFFASSIFFLEHLLTLGWNYQCWRDPLISPTITGIGRLSSTEGPGDGVCLSSFQFVLSS